MMSTRSRTWPLEINVVSSCGTIFDTANPISIIVEKVSLIDTIAARNSCIHIRYQPKTWWQCRRANNCPLNWAKIICAIINNSRALFDPIFNADIRPLYVCTKNNYLLLITRRCWLKLVKNLKKINPFKIWSSIMEFLFLLFSDKSGRRTIFFKYTKPSNLTLNTVFNDQLNTNWTYASFA